jgi:MFS family permease
MEAEARAAASAQSSRLSVMLLALQQRDFRLLWFNSFGFFIGRGMQMVSVSWLVLELTDSPSLVGAVLFVQGAPLALFSLFAGIGADRLDRRMLLIVSQGSSGAITAILTLLVVVDVVATWQVFVLGFAMGTAMALGQPSRQALVPALVGPERLMNAVVLNTLAQNVSFIIGPALGGGLLALSGFEGTFIVQTVLLLAGLPLLLAMRSPAVVREARAASVLADLREGLSYIGRSPLIRSLFLVTGFTGIFFVGTYQAVLPVFARDVLDGGSAGFGLLSAALGAGMLCGSVFIAWRGSFERPGETLLRSMLFGSAIFIAFAASRWYGLSLLTMVAWGFGAAFFMNLTITLIQGNTPDELMGRVMSAQALAFFGLSPIGNLMAGLVAEAIGAPLTVTLSALAVAAMSIYLYGQGELRRLM